MSIFALCLEVVVSISKDVLFSKKSYCSCFQLTKMGK